MFRIIELAKKLKISKPEPLIFDKKSIFLRERGMRPISAPLDEERMSTYLEQKGTQKLPDDYLEFLQNYNGGGPKNICLINNGDNIEIKDFLGFGGLYDIPKLDHFEKNYIPIATDPSGNFFLMSLCQGEVGVVYFWNHEADWFGNEKGQVIDFVNKDAKIADSFSEFLEYCGECVNQEESLIKKCVRNNDSQNLKKF